jgi:hypothetical protein
MFCGAAMVVGQSVGPATSPGGSQSASPFGGTPSGESAPAKPFNPLWIVLAILGGGGLLFCCLIGVVVSIAIPSLKRPAIAPRIQPQPPRAVPFPAGMPNPYTSTLEQLRRQLATTQQRKAAHAEQMQRLGSRAPNPYESLEKSIEMQIENLERASQQWEQRHASQ